ncbi:MAG: transposase family protein [Phormidesmis sp.]
MIARCPLCHCPSDRIHSHYERTLKDLPLFRREAPRCTRRVSVGMKAR